MGRHAFLIIICLAALYPLWFIVSTALRSNAAYQLDPTGFPTHPTLGSLRAMLLDEPLPRWMWNSFLVTVSAVAVSTLVALLAAYAAAFGRFRGHRIFLSTSVALMVVPPITLVVPMFVLMVDTGWINHLQSVIVFYTGLLVPFAIFFLANFFRTVPQELIEAAAVEGAGPFTVLRRVVMPLSGAATFTLVVVQAIWVWNELLDRARSFCRTRTRAPSWPVSPSSRAASRRTSRSSSPARRCRSCRSSCSTFVGSGSSCAG